MDLICGGQIRVLIEHLPVHEKIIDLYHTAQEEFKKSRSFFWIGKITDDNGKLQVEHAIQKAQNEFIGPLQVKHKLQKLNESGTRIFNRSCFMEVAYQKNKLRVGEQTKLYIFSDGVYEVEKSDGSMWQFREFADFMKTSGRAVNPVWIACISMLRTSITWITSRMTLP